MGVPENDLAGIGGSNNKWLMPAGGNLPDFPSRSGQGHHKLQAGRSSQGLPWQPPEFHLTIRPGRGNVPPAGWLGVPADTVDLPTMPSGPTPFPSLQRDDANEAVLAASHQQAITTRGEGNRKDPARMFEQSCRLTSCCPEPDSLVFTGGGNGCAIH